MVCYRSSFQVQHPVLTSKHSIYESAKIIHCSSSQTLQTGWLLSWQKMQLHKCEQTLVVYLSTNWTCTCTKPSCGQVSSCSSKGHWGGVWKPYYWLWLCDAHMHTHTHTRARDTHTHTNIQTWTQDKAKRLHTGQQGHCCVPFSLHSSTCHIGACQSNIPWKILKVSHYLKFIHRYCQVGLCIYNLHDTSFWLWCTYQLQGP